MKELLKKLNACEPAIEWAENKTWEEIYKTCHRGDWLLWLFKETNPDDLQKITLAKGHCAATVLHLMEDERSINAVKVAIAFGEGNASREDLNAASYAAAVAASDASDASDAYASASYAASVAYASASYAASVAFYTAAFYTAADAAYAVTAYAAYAAYTDAAAAAAVAAKRQNQMETADICRKYLPIEIWNIRR